jgi:hypothetical protein
MPATGGASKPFCTLLKKRTNLAKPCSRGERAGYAHVIHRAFPTEWGQLVRGVNGCSGKQPGDISSLMAQGFQRCRLQQSVQGFCTELSTDSWRLVGAREGISYPKKIKHKQRLIKKRTDLCRP